MPCIDGDVNITQNNCAPDEQSKLQSCGK